MNTVLKVTNLSKEYPNFTLEDISFQLPSGTIMGLIGENGAGKTTTLNAILGLIHPDGGSVALFGKALVDDPSGIKENIGVVMDGISFYDTLTPHKVGIISKAAYKQWDDTLYTQYLDKFKLPLNQEIKTLSKGMKMKLNIAVALSHKPKLLILDEATSGLDPIVREDILEVFWDFVQDENHSILMSSHITSDLEKIADFIVFIHQGKIQFCEPKDALIDNYGVLRCGDSTLESIDEEDIISIRRGTYQNEVLIRNRQLAAKKYKSAVVDKASIDEIMLLYIKGEKRHEKFDY